MTWDRIAGAYKQALSKIAQSARARLPSLPSLFRVRCAIRSVCEEQNTSQEEAADRCGLHRTCYSGIETGVRNVSLVNIENIAKGLKKNLPDSFGRV